MEWWDTIKNGLAGLYGNESYYKYTDDKGKSYTDSSLDTASPGSIVGAEKIPSTGLQSILEPAGDVFGKLPASGFSMSDMGLAYNLYSNLFGAGKEKSKKELDILGKKATILGDQIASNRVAEQRRSNMISGLENI